jgi:CheY-like chemotaxis protein
VDDLLDVSRVSSGKIELRKELLPLESVIQNAIEASRPVIDGRRHELILDLPAQSILVDADPTRLSQIIMNLLNNAAKYMDANGRIWLSARQDNEIIEICVKDAGLGIAAEMLPKVFEMFTQVDSTLERSEGGLGIGLTLVRRLVELHGGSVMAFSEGLGKGSAFSIRMPIALKTKSPEPSANGKAGRSSVTKCRVVVVDDNRDSAETMSMLLQVMGHEVHKAFDGLEAIETVKRVQPELVLMDIGLPKLNGYDAARRIRAEFGEQIVLIALTGWAQDEDRRRSQEAGFNEHFVKPIDPGALEQALRNLHRDR